MLKKALFCCVPMIGLAVPAAARAAAPAQCERLVLSGDVHAGSEWRAPIGEGWVFRVMPIQDREYSGWDLVVDRDPPAGYPDALLLATPPYNSINEREIGTTYGLRAQDALGWNPRSFHFLTHPAALRQAQRLFADLMEAGQSRSPGTAARLAELTRQLVSLDAGAASGQFRILDARIVPGAADTAAFAQSWAIASDRTPHSNEPAAAGSSTPRGEFRWMKFSITLWLPAGWKAPKAAQAAPGPCG